MSNSYNQNPILLDTVMSATAKNTAGTPWNSGYVFKIKAIMWDIAAGGASKSVILKDGLGNIIYSGSTTTPGVPQPLCFAQPFNLQDFQLTTIGGGTLYLYLA